jgi:hypothetical protein
MGATFLRSHFHHRLEGPVEGVSWVTFGRKNSENIGIRGARGASAVNVFEQRAQPA